MDKNHINIVDGFRGMAILMVVFQHCYIGIYGFYFCWLTGLSRPYIFSQCWISVNLFFILSGFVLALPYFTKQRDFSKLIDVGKFFKHRLVRLYPLLLVVNTTFLALYYFVQHKNYLWSYFLSTSTLSMFSFSQFFPDINAPTWSLAAEIWFSILFPLIFILIKRFGMHAVLGVTLIMSLVIRYIGLDAEFYNPNMNPIKDSVPARIDDFVVGIYIAYLYVNNKLPDLRSKGVIAGILLTVLAAYGWDLGTHAEIHLIKVFLNNLTQLSFGLLFVGALQLKDSKWNVFNWYWLRLLGVMCYSIYLWHMYLAKEFMFDNPWPLKTQLTFWVLLMVISFLSYSFIEFPKKSFKKLLLKE